MYNKEVTISVAEVILLFEHELIVTRALNDLEKCIPSNRISNIQLPIGIVKKVKDLLPELCQTAQILQ
ncbi:MAG: hypothetical protein JW837_03255 [Sedimentisphaerales bacterium]|nr:hypothetical protein [Sedimentisphaerales bacterium]